MMMGRMRRALPALVLAAVGAATAPALGQKVTGRVTLVDPLPSAKVADNSNAVVWLIPMGDGSGESLAAGTQSSRPALRLVQKHKHFNPHVLVVQVGSTVEFPNLDPFFHNVFSLFEGKRFDLGLYEAGATRNVRFDRRGICYIFCNIHPEMSAVVVVLETPYYGISDRGGEIVIPSVPPGRYQLQVWHERSLPQSLKALGREITVSDDARSFGSIRLGEAANIALSHKNKYGRDYDPPAPANPLYEQP